MKFVLDRLPPMNSADRSGKGIEAHRRRGIPSIEVRGRLLHAMARTSRPMALKELAREADMPAARIHADLVSFARSCGSQGSGIDKNKCV